MRQADSMTGAVSHRSTDHWFFGGISLLLMGYVLLGFWPSYIAAGFVLAPLPSLLAHIHAILFVGWIALFGVQVSLISASRVAVHRRLGTVMGWWAAAMAVVAPATVVMAVRRPHSALGASVLAGDLAQTVAFVILIAAGLTRRRAALDHKRLMTLASAAIIGPAIARWPFEFIDNEPPIGLVLFYLLPTLLLIAYDLATLRRVHRATWLGFGVMLLVLACFVGLPAWHGWLAFANWVKLA